MAKEPWEITQAFAEQLMRNAREQEKQVTQLQLAPVEHAMALDRLKATAAIELANLPKQLAIREGFTERAERRGEEADVRKEQRGEERRGRERTSETQQYGEKIRLGAEARSKTQMEALREKVQMATEAANRGDTTALDILLGKRAPLTGQRGSVRQTTPPVAPGFEGATYAPDIGQDWSDVFQDLKPGQNVHDVYELSPPGTFGAKRTYSYRKKGNAPKEEVPSAPSTSPGGKVDNRLLPPTEYKDPPSKIGVGTNKNPAFDAVGPAKEPMGPAIPPELLRQKVSDLYRSIRRNGYSDEEARTVLASLQQPQVRPTDDPDIFDVLVS